MADLSKELNKELSKDFAYCEDTISRQAAIDALESIGSLDTEADKKYARSVFDALPSVTPTKIVAQINFDNAKLKEIADEAVKRLEEELEPKRKRGKWIERNPQNSDKCRLIECDQCGFSHIVGFNVPYEHWIENRNFCERCGADMRGMRGEQDDND